MLHRLIAIMLLLLIVFPAAAQEDTPQGETFYIYAEINRDRPISAPEFEFGESHTTPQFFKRLGEILLEEGFNPVFLAPDVQLEGGSYPAFFEASDTVPLFYAEQTLWVDLRVTGELDWIYLSPYAAVERPPLPSGTSGWSAVPEVDPLSETQLDLTVQAAAAIALYIADECEAAMPYFDAASADERFLDESLFLRMNLLFYRATCEYLLGNEAEAESLYNVILDTEARNTTFGDPRLVSDYTATNLAWIYATRDRNRQAKTMLDAYRDVDYTVYTSRDTLRFLDRARVYLLLGEEARAVDEITRLLKVAEGDVPVGTSVTFAPDEVARLYTERGRIYAETGDKEAAMADYEQAIATDANYPKAYYLRGQLYSEAEDEAAAREDMESFLNLQPGYYNYYEEDLAPMVESAEEYLAGNDN